MRKILSIVAIVATAFVFAMCNNNGNIPVESNWKIGSVYSGGNEITPSSSHQATLAFMKDSKISGTTGCNRFFGEFSVQDENIKFTNVGSTRMMCPDMAFETALLEAVTNTCSFAIDGNKLMLKDNNGNIVALLEKIEPTTLEN